MVTSKILLNPPSASFRRLATSDSDFFTNSAAALSSSFTLKDKRRSAKRTPSLYLEEGQNRSGFQILDLIRPHIHLPESTLR